MKLNKYLQVFNSIVTHGEKADNKYSLGALSAWHDLDGYTCFIGYQDLTMTLYFHNRFTIDYNDKNTLIDFNRHIDNLLSHETKNEQNKP